MSDPHTRPPVGRSPGESTVHDQEDQTGKDPGTIREAWDRPGHEADAYRASRIGTPGNGEGFDELTAAETPETTRHLSDAHIATPRPSTPPSQTRDLPEAVEEDISVLGAPDDANAQSRGADHGLFSVRQSRRV